MKLLHNQLPTSAQRQTESGWSCHLQAVAFSVPLMLVSRGRGWEEGGDWGGGKAVLFGRSAGIFTSCQQEVRVRRVLPSVASSHTSSREVSVCASSGTVTKLHVCQEEGKPQSTPSGGGSPPALGSGICTPRLASLCLDSTCWRQWPRKDRFTYRLAGKAANTGAAWLGEGGW